MLKSTNKSVTEQGKTIENTRHDAMRRLQRWGLYKSPYHGRSKNLPQLAEKEELELWRPCF